MKIEVHNVISKLHADEDTIKRMRRFLSVERSGAFFIKRKYGRFVDTRKYYMTKSGKFLTGFVPFIVEQLGDVEIIDKRTNLIHFNDEYDFTLGKYSLYDYQQDAVRSCNRTVCGMYWPRAIIDAATNAGKNFIIAALHKNLPGSKTIMLIHDQSIKNQAIEFLSEFFDVGEIHGKKLDLEADFIVAMAKTLINRANTYAEVNNFLRHVNTLIVDESHRASSNEYSKLLSKINAGQRFLVSGTALDMSDKERRLNLIGLCSTVSYKITNAELIAKGISSDIEVIVYLNNPQDKTVIDYRDAYEKGIIYSLPRVSMINQYLKENSERQVIISVDYLEHAEFLSRNLAVDAKVITGETKDREKLLEQFKRGEFRVMITTLFQEGINAPIDTLIYAQGGLSKIPVKQYIGRVLRKMGNFDKVHVVDFYDNVHYLDKHSRSRIRLYNEEGFNINFKYTNRKGIPVL